MTAQPLPPDYAARRMAAMVFALITLALLAGGYWHYRENVTASRQRSHLELAAIAALKASQIEDWMNERRGDVMHFAANAIFQRTLANFLRYPEDPRFKSYLLEPLLVEQKLGENKDILLLAPDGRFLLAVNGSEPVPVDPALQRAIQAALAANEPVFSDFYLLGNNKNEVVIDVVTVVRDDGGQPLALLIFRRDPQLQLFPQLKSWPTPSRSAEVVLSQVEGAEVVFVNTLRNTNTVPMGLRFPLTRTSLPAVQAALGREGIIEGIDYRGVPVLDDLHHILGTRWTMITKVDQEEIFAESRQRTTSTIALISVLIMLAAAGVAYFYRRRQARMFLNLYEAKQQELQTQQALSNSQEQFTQLFENSPVATWLEDLTLLVDWMRQLRTQGVKDLRDYLARHPEQVQHALGLIRVVTVNQAAVLQNAAASKQELMANLPRLFTEPARVAFIEELAAFWEGKTRFEFESRSARLDGQLLDLIVRVEIPRKAGAPDFSHVIITGTDITERQQKAVALRASESALQSVLESTADGILAVDAENKILFANERFAEMWQIPPAIMSSRDDAVLLQHVLDQLSDPQSFLRKVRELYQSPEESFDTLQFKDGRVFERLSHPLLMGDAPNGRVWSFRDVTRRTQAEAALRLSEERWQFALEGAGDGVWDWHVATGEVFLSRQWKAMLGFEEHEIGNHITEWESRVHPEDIARCHEELEGYFSGKSPAYVSEHRMRCKDGSYKWILDRGKIMERTAAGKPLRVIGTHEDITVRKLAEDALRLDSEMMRHMADGIQLTRASDLSIIQVNPQFEQMFGYEPGELVGQKVSVLNAAGDRDAATVAQDIIAVLNDKGSWQGEIQNVKKDGTRFWCFASVSTFEHIAFGKLWVSVHRDITERRLAENALRLSEQKLKSYIENAGDAIYVLDQHSGQLLSCNQKACQELGYSHEELLQLTARDIEAQHQPEQIDRLHRELSEKGMIRTEGVHRRKDGTTFPVEITLSRLDSSEPPSLLSIVRNIAQRKLAEAEIQRRAQELQSINEDLARFNRAAVDRELRMIQLKNEVNHLCRQLGQPPPYQLDFSEPPKLATPPAA